MGFFSDQIPADQATDKSMADGARDNPNPSSSTQGVVEAPAPGNGQQGFSFSAQIPPEAPTAAGRTDDDEGLTKWIAGNIPGADTFLAGWYEGRADAQVAGADIFSRNVIGTEEDKAQAKGEFRKREQAFRDKAEALDLPEVDTSPTVIPDNPVTGKVTVRDAVSGLGGTAAFFRNPLSRWGQVYKDARAAGIDDAGARKAAMIVGPVLTVAEGLSAGFSVGATGAASKGVAAKAAERMGVGGVVKALDRATNKTVKRSGAIALAYGEAFLAEGSQEVFEQAVTNTAITVLDPEDDSIDLATLKKLSKGTGRAFGVGGVTGSGIRAVRSPADVKSIVDTMRKDGEISQETADTIGEVLENISFDPPQQTFGFIDEETLDTVAEGTMRAGAEARSVGRGAAKGATDFAAKWHEPMVQGLEDSESPSVRLIGRQVRRAIDNQRAIRGRLKPQADKVQKLIAGFGGRKKKRAIYRELIREEIGSNGFGDSVFMRAVEDDAVLATLSPDAQEVVREMRQLSMDVASEARRLGMTLELTNGEKVLFQGIEGGRRLSRHMTREFHDIIAQGGVAADRLVRELARRNNVTFDFALKQVQALTSLANTKEIGVEHARVFQDFPTVMWENGQRIPLIDADPITASNATLNSMTGRLGMIQEFGQNPTNLSLLEQNVGEEAGVGARKQVNEVFRAMHGLPINENANKGAEVGTDTAKANRLFQTFTSVMSSFALSGSFVLNAFETLATVPATTGWKNFAAGLVDLAKDQIAAKKAGKSLTEYVDVRKQMTLYNAVFTDILNWNFDPRDAQESIRRLARNTLVGAAAAVNDFNEMANAYAGMKWVEQMQSGQVDLGDVMRLEFMRFTPREIIAIKSGRLPRGHQIWNDIVARAVETGQGTTSVPAERSRAGNNRQWQQWVRFDSYAQKQFNRMTRIMKTLNDESAALGVGLGTNPTAAGSAIGRVNGRRLGKSLLQAGTFWGGGALAGTFAMFTRGVFVGGLSGSDDKFEKFRNEPLRFAKDASLYTIIGGAGKEIHELLFKDGTLGMDSFFPTNVLSEIHDLMKGEGMYAEAGGLEKADIFAKRFAPVYRSATSWAPIIGIGNPNNPKFDNARRAHYAWLRRNVGSRSFKQTDPEIPNDFSAGYEDFRKKMSRAYQWMKKGKNPQDIVELIQEATASGRDPKQSIRAKKWATSVPRALREQYVEDFGGPDSDHIKTLRQHDGLLESWASGDIPTDS